MTEHQHLSMGAETLRRAVTRIRHDVEFGQAHGDDAFLIAVADWLEFEANAIEFDVRVGLTEREATSGAGRPALAVARTYLGEQP